jgi:hypothetical protein
MYGLSPQPHGDGKLDEEHIRLLDDVARLRAARLADLEAIAAEARRYAAFYPLSSDGGNTFVMFAEWVDAHADNLALPISDGG